MAPMPPSLFLVDSLWLACHIVAMQAPAPLDRPRPRPRGCIFLRLRHHIANAAHNIAAQMSTNITSSAPSISIRIHHRVGLALPLPFFFSPLFLTE